MAILLLLGGIFLNLTTTNILLLGQEHEVLKAEWLAKAGISKALHDINEGYSNYTLYSRNINFAEGDIKIGIVAIASLGVREFLIVSKSSLSKNSSISYSLASIVQIDTPSDYVIFSDGDEKWEIAGEIGNMFLGGPVHINGNLHIWVSIYRQDPSAKFLAVVNPSNISGPVVKLKGRLIYEPLTPFSVPQNFDYSNSKVLFANGIIYYKNQMHADLKTDVQIQKSLLLGEATGVELIGFNSYSAKVTDYYPTNKISGSTPDLTGDGILADSDHGGYEIKIPNSSKINKESVTDYIDSSWYIDSLNFSNQTISRMSFANDLIAKKSLIGKGDGNSTKFYYTSKDRKIYNLYVISSDSNGWYTFSDAGPIIIPEREKDKNSAVEGASFIAENGELTLLHTGTTGRSTYICSNSDTGIYYGYRDIEYSRLHQQGERAFVMRELTPMDWRPTKISFIDGGVEYEPSVNDYTVYKFSDDGGTYCTWSGCFWWGFRTNETIVSVVPASLIDIGAYKAYEFSKYRFPTEIIEDKNGNGIFDDVPLAEAKYYAGENTYYDYNASSTQGTTVLYNSADRDIYLAGTSADNPRDYHRYWDSATNQFYVRFRVTPTNNLQIKISKWWFPKARRGEGTITTTKFKIYRNPPDSTSYLYTDQWIDALKLDLSKITKYNFPKQQQYPLGFDDYNKNGKQDINEPSKYGIIYSKVPLVIGGIPEVPVTIYSEEDVYLQSINKEYPDDYENVQPVGIVTKKVAFTYHAPYTSESDLILNKVAIFTRGERIFEFGGTPGIPNRTKLIGSLVKNKINEKGEEDYYRSSLIAPRTRDVYWVKYLTKLEMNTVKTVYIFGEQEYWNKDLVNQIRYASSFRDNPPHNLSYYIKVKSLRHVTQKSADEFYNNLSSYIGIKKIPPSEIYIKLLMELE